MREIETHPFKPFIPTKATMLIVGSFPGRDITQKILEKDDWFYATKRNQFWSIISGVYNIELKNATDKKELFTVKGIAIADIILKARRNATNNSDSNLEVIAYNDMAIKNISGNKKRRMSSVAIATICENEPEGKDCVL